MQRATPEERERLNALFAELCAIASPSGHEAACAARVRAELEGLGLAVDEDEAGNLLARIPARAATAARADVSATPEPTPGLPAVGTGGPVVASVASGGDASVAAGSGAAAGSGPAAADDAAPRTILLCAHLDTVPHGDTPIEPVLVDEGWENANDAILGADNKAAVAVMLAAARRAVAQGGAEVGLELLFTTGEETALLGAKQFDLAKLQAEWGYVYDHATPIGEIVMASPTYYKLEAEFHGQAAHAGIRPEDGRNAIVAAAKAIATITSGRIDDETTTNVAGIEGGRPHTNVVPDRARFWAEARSLDPRKAEAEVAKMVDAIQEAAGDTSGGCDVDVDVEKLFTGYRHDPQAPQVLAAERALARTGYTPRHITTGGGSDANVFEAAGFPCTNLANGTERNHETTERVSVAALEGMLDVTFALMEDCAT